ncbi:GAP family protein [Mycobacterium sp. SMC-2]|uniref:GAP family protein n=1 Tax=Mycobacterium sp. SMC-2 TaxID=2857058 RepID=UPI0021B327A9|nr:GAP family protein [Mycobacterium sp. SMC-2]UXA09620.1 GAP family protein [Mycobacterium sp. SMC-2]
MTAPALVVALSPIPVVVALVLLIHNDRPYSSSVAYLLGRLASLTVLAAGFMQFPRWFDDLMGPAPPWADWVVVGVGSWHSVRGCGGDGPTPWTGRGGTVAWAG